MAVFSIRHSFSNEGARNDVRSRVVRKFLEENHGTGIGDNTAKYKYIVEELSDGNQIILTRPANLKNGFDFLISVSNHNFNEHGRKRDYPKHDEILQDLEQKKVKT